MAERGQPAKYKTVEELQAAIDEYFRLCDEHTKTIKPSKGKKYTVADPLPYTMTGLTIALGFESRTSLVDYKGRGDEYSNTIKKARLRVEESIEQRMLKSNGVVAGVIFNAKNNFGWRDKTETEITDKTKRPNPFEGLTTEQLRKLAKGK